MLFTGRSWIPEVAALFIENELAFDDERFGCHATAAQIRDRLRVLGFTLDRAYADVAGAVRRWNSLPAPGEVPDEAQQRAVLLAADLQRIVNLPSDDENWERRIDYEDPAEFTFAACGSTPRRGDDRRPGSARALQPR